MALVQGKDFGRTNDAVIGGWYRNRERPLVYQAMPCGCLVQEMASCVQKPGDRKKMLTMTKGTGIFLKIFADCWVTNRLKFHKGVNKVNFTLMKLSDFYDEEIIVGFFYGELRGMLETIRYKVFNGRVEYDEMVSELYLFLAQDDWRRIRTFDARNGCSLRTWLSTVAWRFFLGHRKWFSSLPGECPEECPSYPSKGVVDRVDVRMVLEAMPNHRYAEAVNLLVLRGYEVKEVAELWHTNVSNVYNIRHRAINQFRECYLSSNHGKRIG